MKRLKFVTLAAASLTLVACGNGGQEADQAEPAETEEAETGSEAEDTGQDTGEEAEDSAEADSEADQEEGDQDSAEAQNVTVGVVTDRAAEIWGDVSDRLEEKENITIEPVVLSDFRQPNEAVSNGELDANAYQYIPFLYEYNTAEGENLRPIGYLSVEPIGIWAVDGIETVDDVPEGAQVSIYNDPTNLGNSLTHLEKAGLITLDEDAGPTPTQDDIVDNPLNLEFVELEAGQIPRSLGDSELVVVGATMAAESGMDLDNNFYFEDTSNTSKWFRLNFVVPEDKVDDEVLNKVLDEYQSQETLDYANETGEGFYAGWENDDNPNEDYEEYADQQ